MALFLSFIGRKAMDFTWRDIIWSVLGAFTDRITTTSVAAIQLNSACQIRFFYVYY
jgi:hypothetical protein